MNDHLPAFVRTLVPIVVGPLVARLGFDVTDPNTLAVVSGALAYAWYVLVHTVELRWPAWGFLLGIAKTPAYSTEPAPSPGPGEDVEAVVTPEGGYVEIGLLGLVLIIVLVVLLLR